MIPWLLDYLACPRHKTALSSGDDRLTCPAGCVFPVVGGVPVLLLEDVSQTIDLAWNSLRLAKAANTDGGLYIDSLGIADREKQGILELAAGPPTGIDPVASFLVGATNGIAYKNQIGRLDAYPIPDLRLPPGEGRVFLDVGCSWGRWCTAAHRKGYRAIGVDPSLGAVMAATRIARQLETDAAFVVADARFLPFKAAVIDQAFSYSVLQHLSRADVAMAVAEIGRVLREQGAALIQMPTKFGLRCLYHQARRRFREASGFEVRYWSLPELRRLFEGEIGATGFSADCFFGIGLQASDLRFMTPPLKAIVRASETLRVASQFATPLVWTADSVYVSSAKRARQERQGR